jgi:hypothetical protein
MKECTFGCHTNLELQVIAVDDFDAGHARVHKHAALDAAVNSEGVDLSRNLPRPRPWLQ